MDLGLAGRTAVIVGASQGIGKAVAFALAAEGMRLVMLARDAAGWGMRRQQVREHQPDADILVIPTDVTDRAAVERAATEVAASHRQVHVIVNNAGNRMRPGRQIEWDDHEWLGDIDSKLLGMLRIIRAFDRLLPVDGAGRIVNVSGVAGSIVWETALTHGINNSAMNHVTRYLADRPRASAHHRQRRHPRPHRHRVAP